MGIRTFLAGIALLTGSAQATPQPALSAAEAKPDRSFVYTWREIDSAGLPTATLARRREDQALVTACGAAGQGFDRSAFLVGLLVEAVNLGIKAIDKAISEREQRYLDSLSSTSSATNTSASFPFDARGGRQCLIVDRVSSAGDDRATYVLGLRSVGTGAFTVELIGARLTDRTLTGRRKLPDKVNADIALTLTTVEPDTDGGRSEQRSLPLYSAAIKNLDPMLIAPEMAADPARPMSAATDPHVSPVLPLPRLATPTTISVVVVESNSGLAKAKERVALAQKIRAKLIELTAGAIKEQIEKLAQ